MISHLNVTAISMISTNEFHPFFLPVMQDALYDCVICTLLMLLHIFIVLYSGAAR